MDEKTLKKLKEAASIMGKIGGSKTSEAKKRTARENGKKGGKRRMITPEELMAALKQTHLEAIRKGLKK